MTNSRRQPSDTQRLEDNKDVTEPRFEIILWLRAIIDKCKAIRKHRIKKTIESIFAEIKTPEGYAPTLKELYMAWEISKTRMRARLCGYRKCTNNKLIVPYPTKVQGRWVYSDQTRQEYREIQNMRTRIHNGSQKIDAHMMTIIRKNPAQREKAVQAAKAEIEQEITVGQSIMLQQNGKKKRRKAVV